MDVKDDWKPQLWPFCCRSQSQQSLRAESGSLVLQELGCEHQDQVRTAIVDVCLSKYPGRFDEFYNTVSKVNNGDDFL